ncbi:odorant receptor 49b-like isoform X2 [Apis florea]|uniref:odorant receptor 49b-like isoform X2 n=1 Tax=Apis florea TaxID=7463 RepID=UPI000252AF00|nr:odorant receptor 49b-like isoform X2 [Apis florea]
MSRVRKAENGMRHTVWFTYPLLRILGAWPNRVSSSTLSKILNWYLIFTCYTLQLIVLVPGFLHVFLKEKNGRKKMKMMIPQVNGYLQLCKYSLVLRWTNKLRVLLDEMKKDWLNTTEEDESIFRAKANFGHRVMSMIAIVTYSAGLGYRTILPLSKGRILLPNNTTKRLLPCPGYFVFFNEQVSPIYEIIFIIQVLGGLLTYTIMCGTIGMCVMFCLHSSSLLRILLNKICQFTKQLDMNEVVVHEKIVDIVKYQTKVKGFLKNVEQLTTYLFLLEIMVETSIGCVIGYNVVTEWEDSNTAAIIIHLMMQASIVSCTFIMCYVGQILIDEGNNVRRMSITIDWYRFPVKEARNLILVIIMSSYPVKLTAGKVVDISLATFTDIIKTTVGYLNMLQKVT